MKPCCDRRTMVAMIAMIDMTFGAILFGLCIQSLLFFSIPDEFSEMPWTRLLLLFPIILNTFQILISFHLLMSIKQINPLVSLAKTTIWLHGGVITLTCLVIKFFFLLLNLLTVGPKVFGGADGTNGRDGSINLLMTLTLWEMMTKIISLYLIRGYLEELEIEAYPPAPNVQFYSVHIPPSISNATLLEASGSPPPPMISSPWVIPTQPEGPFVGKNLEDNHISNFSRNNETHV